MYLRTILGHVLAFFSLFHTGKCAANASVAKGDLILFYPVNSPWLNIIDTLVVSWTSEWKNVNASAWCKTDNATSAWKYKNFGQWDQNGSFIIPNVNQYFKAYQFPTVCHFNLRDQKNSSDGGNGGQFVLTSLSKSASTAKAFATTSGSKATATAGSSSNDSAAITSPTGPDATQTSSSNFANTSQGTSGGLSKVAYTMIGVLIPVLFVVAIAAFFLSSRRKNKSKISSHSTTESHEKETRSGPSELDGGSGRYQAKELDQNTQGSQSASDSTLKPVREAPTSFRVHELP